MALADHIQYFAATDVGRKRNHNEDTFLADAELGLFIVADGMGGHAAGEIASRMAVETVHQIISSNRQMIGDRNENGPRSEVSTRQLLSLLDYAIQMASDRIHREAQSDAKKRGMGTTISLLLLAGGNGYVAHVGDSRIYLVRDGAAHQVTEDHTVANELLRLGMVTRDQLHRIPRKNAITRAVGVYQHAEVDTLTLEVLPNDQFLLSSDGLTGYFDEAGVDLLDYVCESEGERVVEALVDFANERGGKDNITALLVRLGSGDTSDGARARRVQLKREMLAAMPLFSRLNERELLRVMQVADVYQLDKGEVVVREGEPGDRMYVILQGRLQVARGSTTLDELGPGEQLGEMALIRSTPRSATVTALENTELITLTRADFFEIIRTEPHVAVKLLWQFLTVLADRLEQTSQDLSVMREELSADSARSTERTAKDALDDPFSQPVPLRLGGFSLGLRDEGLPATLGDWPPVVAEGPPAGAPTFQDAPELARRIDDPPSNPIDAPPSWDSSAGELRVQDAAGPPFEDRPSWEHVPEASPPGDDFQSWDRAPGALQDETRRRIEALARELDEEEADVPFDAKRTRPGTRRREKTLPLEPSDADKRLRSRTLPSAGSVPPDRAPPPPAGSVQPVSVQDVPPPSFDSITGPPAAPPLPSRPPAPAGTPPPRDQVATLPDPAAARIRSTVPDGSRTPLTGVRGPGFQPTKQTIPLEPPDQLKQELEALRKEFKERLKSSRRQRNRKDSD